MAKYKKQKVKPVEYKLGGAILGNLQNVGVGGIDSTLSVLGAKNVADKWYSKDKDAQLSAKYFDKAADIGGKVAPLAAGVVGTVYGGPAGGAAAMSAMKGIQGIGSNLAGDADPNNPLSQEGKFEKGLGKAAGIGEKGLGMYNSMSGAFGGMGGGTATGGEAIAGGMDLKSMNTGDMTGDMLQNMNGAGDIQMGRYGGKIKCENGGELTQYNGYKHEMGGIAIGPQNEVEDGETRGMANGASKDYIFSDNLKVPGKKQTYAQLSKMIEKKHSKRTNDKLSEAQKEHEINALMGSQEELRSTMMDKAYQKAYGGELNKLPNGGKLKPYVTSDPNDPRIGAYKDSLALNQFSNKTLDLLKKAEDSNDYGYYNQHVGNAVESGYRDKLVNMADKRGIQPTGTYQGKLKTFVDQFPAPQQRVIYQPKESKNTVNVPATGQTTVSPDLVKKAQESLNTNNRYTTTDKAGNKYYFANQQPVNESQYNTYYKNLPEVQYALGGGLDRSKDYGNKENPYPSVQSNDFAGGNRSYPIPTQADAVDALRLAGLHNRSDVKAKVYAKYPTLKHEDGGLVAPGFIPRPVNSPYISPLEQGRVDAENTQMGFANQIVRPGIPFANTPEQTRGFENYNALSTSVDLPNNYDTGFSTPEGSFDRFGTQTAGTMGSKLPGQGIDPSMIGTAANFVGPAYDIYRGLKGGDKVDYERVNPDMVNYQPERDLTARNIKEGFMNTRSELKNINSPSQYLAAISQVSGQRDKNLSDSIAKSYQNEANMNAQIGNQAKYANAATQRAETDARQQEKDIAKNTLSTGLYNAGAAGAQAGVDSKSYSTQAEAKKLVGTGDYTYQYGPKGKITGIRFNRTGKVTPIKD